MPGANLLAIGISRYVMPKKNLSLIIIILLTMLLIAIVIWLYDIRIKNVEKKMTPVASFISKNLNTTYYEKDSITTTVSDTHHGV